MKSENSFFLPPSLGPHVLRFTSQMTKYRHSEQLVGTFPAVFHLIVPIMESFHVVQLEEISCRFRILLQFSQGLLTKYISEQELI
jgi:hypothetical protein